MELYNKYSPALLRKCERMLGNQHDAEDVVHALFVELIGKKNTEVDLPYLYRAATNRCITILRKRKNHKRLLNKQQSEIFAPPRTMIDEKTISLDMLTKLLQKLDKKSSQILVYKYLDDLKQDEIARVIGMSRQSIRRRLIKINRLARQLSEASVNGVRR
ncbi:MAG: sigma-70 family RNA polymerase sigma factor [Proteobacteria bacterium]|nr:sigma-70 family RNA polymerase sigma factor [Pseudomonadota bacterium]